MGKVILAVICTLAGGVLASFLEPPAFANSIPLAIMGGFILAALRRREDE